MCKSSYLWRTKPQGDGWDLYFPGLLPSVVQPPGFPISPRICQPSQPSLLANIPKGMLLRHWGCFHTSQVLAQLPPGCKWKEWQDFYCWESLNRTGSGWVVLGDPTQLLQQLGQNLELSQGQKKTAPASPCWAQVTCKDGCRSEAELWFPAEDSDGRGVIIYSTFKGFFFQKANLLLQRNSQPPTTISKWQALNCLAQKISANK